MTEAENIRRGMKRIAKIIEKRIGMLDRAEVLAARAEARRSALPALADFDMRGLARRVRPMLAFDGRGHRAIGAEMGVSAADLSRMLSGQHLAWQKVRAICDWAGISADLFYVPAAAAAKPRKRPRPVAARGAGQKKFHVGSTETVGMQQ